jgi:hypothetical protein
MKLNPRNKLVCGLIAVVLFTQTSCMDLVGLRKFTDETVKAGTKFKALSQDIYRSCAREIYYQRVKTGGFTNIPRFDSPDAFLVTVPDRRKPCDDFKREFANFKNANKILMTYFYVMGQLAADDVANADDEFKGAKDALSGVAGFNTALNIGNTITNILLDSARRKGIKKAVINTNTDIGALTDSLSNAMDNYIAQLNAEKSRLIEVYDFAVAQHLSEPLIIIPNSINLDNEIQNINTKIKAAEAYKEVLAGIKKGHQDLYAEAQRGFNQKQVVKIALQYAPAIQSNFDELAKAF